jgi:hypothetical protein
MHSVFWRKLTCFVCWFYYWAEFTNSFKFGLFQNFGEMRNV